MTTLPVAGVACSSCRPQLLAIEGVACCFKTSALQLLAKEKYPVYFGDFSEFHMKQEDWCRDDQDVSLRAYSFEKCMQLYRGGVVYDRLPISVLLYDIIRNVPRDREKKALNDLLAKWGHTMTNWHVLVVLPRSNPDEVVMWMKRRNTGIDLFSRSYVEAQTRIFKSVANHFKWPILYVDHKKPTESVLALNMSIHLYLFQNAITNKLLTRKPYVMDTGIDLHLENTMVCEKAGVPLLLMIKERIVLPEGYFGYILPRSSTNLKLGSVRSGVLYAGYSGPLSLVFVPDQDGLKLYRHQRIAQLLIHGTGNLKLAYMERFVDLSKFVPRLRGDSGLGSSGM